VGNCGGPTRKWEGKQRRLWIILWAMCLSLHTTPPNGKSKGGTKVVFLSSSTNRQVGSDVKRHPQGTVKKSNWQVQPSPIPARENHSGAIRDPMGVRVLYIIDQCPGPVSKGVLTWEKAKAKGNKINWVRTINSIS